MKRWLEQSHVRAAFGEPREWLDEIEAHLASDWIAHFIAEMDGEPLGFAQHYDTRSAPLGAWSSQPVRTRGIDFFLGDIARLGVGLGAELLAEFADFVERSTDALRLVVDPDQWNTASIRCAERCGFARDPRSGLWVRAVDPGSRSG